LGVEILARTLAGYGIVTPTDISAVTFGIRVGISAAAFVVCPALASALGEALDGSWVKGLSVSILVFSSARLRAVVVATCDGLNMRNGIT
jgi:hypothetical protein